MNDLEIKKKQPELINQWSVRFSAFGALLTTALLAFPEAALSVWNVLPQDLKDNIPEEYTPIIGMVIVIVSMLSKITKQIIDKGTSNEQN